jgi:hypothetical protein
MCSMLILVAPHLIDKNIPNVTKTLMITGELLRDKLDACAA